MYLNFFFQLSKKKLEIYIVSYGPETFYNHRCPREGTGGFKSRIRPLYPHRVVKGN